MLSLIKAPLYLYKTTFVSRPTVPNDYADLYMGYSTPQLQHSRSASAGHSPSRDPAAASDILEQWLRGQEAAEAMPAASLQTAAESTANNSNTEYESDIRTDSEEDNDIDVLSSRVEYLTVALHIRRGDVSIDGNTPRYVSDK